MEEYADIEVSEDFYDDLVELIKRKGLRERRKVGIAEVSYDAINLCSGCLEQGCGKKKKGSKQSGEGSEYYVVEPELVVASAILLTCEQRGIEMSVEKVANVTGISESKLRKLYPEIRACMIKCSVAEAG